MSNISFFRQVFSINSLTMSPNFLLKKSQWKLKLCTKFKILKTMRVMRFPF